jgi:hypothetical protein
MSVAPRKCAPIQGLVFLVFSCALAAQTSPSLRISPSPPKSKSARNSVESQGPRRHTGGKPSPGKESKTAPQPAAPPGPLQPLTLDQMPVTAPEVLYRAGQLTITARNSSLGDILRAVRSQTGASFDVPPSATERVVGRFGPGPENQVLATLLNGSHFNYVMLGSATDATAVTELILTPRAGESTENAPAYQADQGFHNTGPTTAFSRPINPNGQVPPPQVGDGATDADNATDGDESADQAEQSDGDQEGAPQGVPNGQPAVKTPQQLLQELQQQQLIQQQQQRQQPQGQNPQQQPANPNPQLIPPQRPELQQRPERE